MVKIIQKDQKAVAGFFLDGPILLVVILIITIMIAIISQAYLAHRENLQRKELDKRCLDLKREVQTHPELVIEKENRSENRQFCIEKLEGLDSQEFSENITNDFDLAYQITIEDEREEKEWKFTSEEPKNSDIKSSFEGPILLVEGEENEEVYVGILKVVVW